MTYLERLQTILAEHALTYKDVARITGLSYGTVKNALSGQKPFPRWLKLVIELNELKEQEREMDELTSRT